MNFTSHDLQLESLDAMVSVDTLLLFVSEDERPLPGLPGLVDWRLCGSLSRVLLADFFQGKVGESMLLPTDGRLPQSRIIVLGTGKAGTLEGGTLSDIFKAAAQTLNKVGSEGVALDIPGAGTLDEEGRAKALRDAFLPGFKGQHVALLAEKSLSRLLGK